MIGNQLLLPQMSEPSWAEAFLQSIHNAVAISSVPIVAPAICSLLSSRLQDLGEKRFKVFMEDVIGYLQKLDKKVLESDDFIIATEITIKKIVNEHSQSKRKKFSMLYNGFIQQLNFCESPQCIEHLELFLSIVSELSDNALRLLVILKQTELISPFSAITDRTEKFNNFNELSEQKGIKLYHHRSMAELESTGLVTQASGLWGSDIPYITPLGLDFIQWLEKDNNETIL